MMYYIQNLNAGFLGNSPVFWSKNGGYSQWLDEAQTFTEAEANTVVRTTSGTHRWKLWPVDEIDSIAKRTVDIQDMRKLPCLKNSEYSDE